MKKIAFVCLLSSILLLYGCSNNVNVKVNPDVVSYLPQHIALEYLQNIKKSSSNSCVFSENGVHYRGSKHIQYNRWKIYTKSEITLFGPFYFVFILLNADESIRCYLGQHNRDYKKVVTALISLGVNQ